MGAELSKFATSGVVKQYFHLGEEILVGITPKAGEEAKKLLKENYAQKVIHSLTSGNLTHDVVAFNNTKKKVLSETETKQFAENITGGGNWARFTRWISNFFKKQGETITNIKEHFEAKFSKQQPANIPDQTFSHPPAPASGLQSAISQVKQTLGAEIRDGHVGERYYFLTDANNNMHVLSAQDGKILASVTSPHGVDDLLSIDKRLEMNTPDPEQAKEVLSILDAKGANFGSVGPGAVEHICGLAGIDLTKVKKSITDDIQRESNKGVNVTTAHPLKVLERKIDKLEELYNNARLEHDVASIPLSTGSSTFTLRTFKQDHLMQEILKGYAQRGGITLKRDAAGVIQWHGFNPATTYNELEKGSTSAFNPERAASKFDSSDPTEIAQGIAEGLERYKNVPTKYISEAQACKTQLSDNIPGLFSNEPVTSKHFEYGEGGDRLLISNIYNHDVTQYPNGFPAYIMHKQPNGKYEVKALVSQTEYDSKIATAATPAAQAVIRAQYEVVTQPVIDAIKAEKERAHVNKVVYLAKLDPNQVVDEADKVAPDSRPIVKGMQDGTPAADGAVKFHTGPMTGILGADKTLDDVMGRVSEPIKNRQDVVVRGGVGKPTRREAELHHAIHEELRNNKHKFQRFAKTNTI